MQETHLSWTLLPDQIAWNAERILVNGEHFGRRHQAHLVRRHHRKVRAKHKRTFHKCPEREVRPLLLEGEEANAYLKTR